MTRNQIFFTRSLKKFQEIIFEKKMFLYKFMLSLSSIILNIYLLCNFFYNLPY